MQAAQLAAQQNAPDAKDKLAEAVISASRESSQRIKCPLPSLKVSEGCNSRWSPVGAESSEAVLQ